MSQGKNLILQELRLSCGANYQDSTQGVLFAFIKKGRGSYLTRKREQIVSAGDVLVVNDSSAGKWCAEGTQGMTIKYFYAWMDSLVPLLTSLELCHLEKLNAKLTSLLLQPASTDVAKQCHALIDGLSRQVSLEHRCQLLRVISILFSDHLTAPENYVTSQEPPTSRMMEALENLTAEDIQNLTVAQLSNKCGCCRRHLNRLFQERFGTSVAALKMELRMLRAAALLRDPSAKIINVAMETGFNHLGLFSNYFKRRFGANPSEWRRKELPVPSVGFSTSSKPPPGAPPSSTPCQFQVLGLCPIPNYHAKNGASTKPRI